MHVQHKSEHSTQYHWVFEEFLVASGIIKAESGVMCVFVYTHTRVPVLLGTQELGFFGKEPRSGSRWEPDDITSL